jgi:hypothetical protein
VRGAASNTTARKFTICGLFDASGDEMVMAPVYMPGPGQDDTMKVKTEGVVPLLFHRRLNQLSVVFFALQSIGRSPVILTLPRSTASCGLMFGQW